MKKNLLNLITLLSGMLILFSSSLNAQSRTGLIGASASLQDLQLDLNIPIWVGEQTVIAPSLGLVSISDRATDWGIGTAVRAYYNDKKVSPYAGARFGYFIFSPKNGDTITDFLFGLILGGEYFLDPRFSIGGELQLNITKSGEFSNRFGNPDGTNINTATAAYLTIYF